MKTATRSRAGPRRGLALLATALLLTATIATPALGEPETPDGDTNFEYTWDGHGSDSEKCDLADDDLRDAEDGWIHWVFSTKGESTTATLTLNGTGSGTYAPGPPLEADAWHFYTPYFDLDGLSASITLDAEAGPGNGLVISDYCPGEVPPPTGSATVVKDWDGDGFDDTDIAVTFTGHIDDGDAFTLDPDQAVDLDIDQTLTITDEDVTGLPEGCTYVTDLDDGKSFTATEDNLHGTITITNTVTCPDEPDLIPVGIYKLWLDEDGEIIADDETPDADFTLTLSVDDDVLASLDQDSELPGAWAELEPDTTYTVAETDLADGWETVTCPEFDEEAGAGEHSGVGTFELTDGGRHFVCNQLEIEPETLPVVITEPEQEELEVAPTVEEKEIEEKKVDEEAEVEVLAEVQERELPRTGADTAALALLAAGMLMLGAAVLAGTTPAPARRRRQ